MTDPYGYVSVIFPVLEQGAQDLVGVHNTLRHTLEHLQDQLTTKLAQWEDTARDAYFTCQAAWEADADNMAQSLKAFGDYVDQARDHYINTEAKNTGIWTS
jgi:WXG100 family type VII secretion target